MNRVKTIRGRDGNEVEVVTRTPSKKRKARETLFGSPEPILMEQIERGMDNVLYASLDALMEKKDA